MATFQMSLAFHWEIPGTMIYAFHQLKNDGSLERQEINGCSLSNGRFLFDQFTKSGDKFCFRLYEWTHNAWNPLKPLHAPPTILRISSENFTYDDLFQEEPDFDKMLLEPRKVTKNSPFPGLTNLYSWFDSYDEDFTTQIRSLQEQQTFRIRAKLVVSTRPGQEGVASRAARIFLFDPEMTVGDDGDEPDDPVTKH